MPSTWINGNFKIFSIVIITILLKVNLVFGQDCDKLSDGKYKVKFDKQYGGGSYTLILEGDQFTETIKGKDFNGKVEINENCKLLLDHKMQLDTTNAVQRVFFNSQQPYFEFEGTRGKKLRFRLTGFGGPHITAGTGAMTKVK